MVTEMVAFSLIAIPLSVSASSHILSILYGEGERYKNEEEVLGKSNGEDNR